MGGRRARKKQKEQKQRARRAARKKAASPRRLGAASADKYELYQRAVQSPEDDVVFLEEVSQRLRGRPATHLREDFCGTALLASHWLRRNPDYSAEGFDIDPEPIAWGLERNFEPFDGLAARMGFHEEDVRKPSRRRPDLRVAFNFSYCCFKSRDELVGYFRAVHEDLAEGGVFLLDIHGGPECQEEMEEERDVGGGVTYVWEQEEFWPGTHETRCHITFEFRDRSKLQRVFSYDWRLWTVPELRDALLEAGFSKVMPWWEGEDDDGEGNGEFEPDPRGDNCLSWIAYVVAER